MQSKKAIKPLVFIELNEVNFDLVYRAQCNLTFSHPSYTIAPPHIDCDKEHKVLLYYVNDSDGDTIIYEQTVKDTPCGSVNVDLKEHKRVKPKKGRMVLFDGYRYHCSSQPKNNYRCIINFDLV